MLKRWRKVLLRITPACAGKTHGADMKRACGKDHPRVCGENITYAIIRRVTKGSPPRVRGKHSHEAEIIDAKRITPACAGKTTRKTFLTLRRKDHPRVCGENLLPLVTQAITIGSPPRVRGKLLNTRRKLFNVEDHPRVCGENYDEFKGNIKNIGSPPRVRGKLSRFMSSRISQRITPACAGKTLGVVWLVMQRRDHPRVCGENMT